uniref:SCAN box domain-containing protein n=1 Tax=Loxodonta africana TaxID=9785 RepID=G3SLW0_LOXAF
MVDLKVAMHLNPQIRALQETKGSVTEKSSHSMKATPQMDSLCRESSRRDFRNFCYHEAAGPIEAVSQLKELCYRWLRPEIHSKEQILELLVIEQFLTILPRETQTQMQKHHPQSIKEAVALIEYLQREPESGETRNGVVFHELGKEAVILGGTAVGPGFMLKTAEPQSVGRLQNEEVWNTYQGLQEQPSKNTHKETKAVYKKATALRTPPTLALSEQTNTKDWTVAPKLILPESQGDLYFEKVSIYFEQGEEPWIQGPEEFKDSHVESPAAGLKFKNDTGNHQPASLPALEIEAQGDTVSKNARVKVHQKTTGKENQGDIHRAGKR